MKESTLTFDEGFTVGAAIGYIFGMMCWVILMSIPAQAQVYIPDLMFRRELINNLELNTNGDISISYEEAEAYTGEINLQGKGVFVLTGLEAFTSLTGFNCVNNYFITKVDVSQNTELTNLRVDNNRLIELDITNNPLLEVLALAGNNIDELDASNNPLITFLSCYNNDMKYLDIRNCNINMVFGATLNPNLCIAVDDTSYANTTWDFIDATAMFTTDCSVGIQEHTIKPQDITTIYDIQGRKVNQTTSGFYIIGRTVKGYK